MLAKFEHRFFENDCKVWIVKYLGLNNVSHWHFESELIACEEGSATVIIDGTKYLLEKGMCISICGERIHQVIGSPDSLLTVVQYENTIKNQLKYPLFTDQYNVFARLEEILDENKKKQPFYAQKINSLLDTLIIDIFRHSKLEPITPVSISENARFNELLNLIDHFYEDFTFANAAKFMNISDAYFSKLFKKRMGVTFSYYLNAVRVGKAIELLRKQDTINIPAIMSECGFNTIRNFNRVFKDITGFSPSKLPKDYVLNIRSLSIEYTPFDPTEESSVLL